MAAKLLVLLCCLCTCVSVSHAQLSSVNIGSVVGSLGRRFEEIRKEGLGIDELEKAYLDEQFTYNTLTQAQIDSTLSSTTISDPINSLITSFDDLSSSNYGSSSPLTPEDCCSTTGSDACCHSCASLTGNSMQLNQQIAGAFSQSSLVSGSQEFFGFSDGPLIVHPPGSSNCTIQDARLQRWYGRTVRRSLEVVIVLDLRINENPANLLSSTDISRLREAGRTILRSLTEQDRAAVVRVDRLTRIAPIVSTQAADTQDPKTLPICDEIVTELESYVISLSEMAADPDYNDALVKGVSLFSDDPNTDKILVALFPGPVSAMYSFSTVAQAVVDRGNDLSVSLYRSLDLGITSTFDGLSELGLGGGANVFLQSGPDLPPLIGGFYSQALPSMPSSDVVLGRTVSSLGDNVLTISRPFVNGSNLIGVFHAEIPWTEQLLAGALTELQNRDSSYLFAVSYDRKLLFHPLLPGEVLKAVLVTDVETDGVIGGLLNRTKDSSTTQSEAVTKTLLLTTSGQDPHGYVVRRVPAMYYCRDIGSLFICMLLADEDVTIATLDRQTVNLENLYSANPSRLPLYHNLMLSTSTDNQCDYFCKQSVADRVSFQLTSPSQPPTADDATLVQEVSDYIGGRSTSPAWAEMSVATDIGLSSAVASSWLNVSSKASDYITRRHLATPSGAYLTFPPTQLVREFQPTRSEWYTSSQAHPSLLTLTPPHEDPFREGTRFTVSLGYVVRTPISDSDTTLGNGGQTLSVVAAELSLESLRAFVRQALPQCEQNSQISCFIIDDIGNIVYDDVVSSDPRYMGEAHFLGREFQSNLFHERRTLVTDLLSRAGSNQLMTKMECADYFSLDVQTRRFYSLDLSSEDSVSSIGGSSCIDYLIQRIPGTNAFMVVLQEKSDCSSFCFCTPGTMPRCNDCIRFSSIGCECPCVCPDDCSSVREILACPVRSIEPVNYESSPSATSTTPAQDTCFNQNCNCRTSINSCLGVRECNWCPTEQKCVYNTECCNTETENCCNSSPQIDRFDLLTCNLMPVCTRDPSGSLESVCTVITPEPNTAIIVAGIIGGIFAVLLLGVIIALIVWYQVCRRDDPREETSRESAFDFSNKRTEASNPTSNLEEIRSDDGASKTNSPGTSPNTQLVEETKIDEKPETPGTTL